MKKFTKLLGIVLIMALVMSMGVANAFAATDPAAPDGRTNGAPLTDKSITLTNPTVGHTYELYQIFTGTFAGIKDDNDVNQDTLGNLAYGNGLKLTDGKYDGKTAEELAKTITNTAEGARAFANSVDGALQNGVSKTTVTPGDNEPVASLVWDGLSEGYYIIKDVTTTLPEGHTRDLVVVQVLDDVVITAKSGTVEFDKKVKDRNDSTMKPTVYDEWGNTSDYDVGDDVPYQVTIKLPANFTSYKTYTMTVHDKMDAGLSFNNDVVIKIGETVVPESAYTVNFPSNIEGETFDIHFNEVVGLTGAGDNVTFTVTYSAKLTGENVVYGNPGNKNDAWLTYSNNPTTGQEGGTTPHKITVTFTYKLEVDKVDQDKQPLDGAAFKLEKAIKGTDENVTWTVLDLVEGTSGTIFTFDGLDDGFYRITETETPAGYNSINPIYFTVTATHTETLDNLTVTQVGKDGQALDTNAVTATFNTTLTKEQDGKDAGLIDTQVVNNSGTVLPSTGGIGTTIFYVVGSILVVAAGVLLITKKRMSREG